MVASNYVAEFSAPLPVQIFFLLDFFKVLKLSFF